MKTFDPRLIRSMKRYVETFFPTISDPLKKETHEYSVGYSRGQLNNIRTYIIYLDKNDDIVIKEHIFSSPAFSARFYVLESLEPMYNLFGEEAFEEYFRQVHDIDISRPMGFNSNWHFEEF
jgi:hypothetical protein